MIVKENVKIGEKDFIHTYSDEKFYIRKVGTNEVYEEAYDVIDYEYEETEDKIPEEENVEPDISD